LQVTQLASLLFVMLGLCGLASLSHVSFVNVIALGLCYQSSGPTNFCPKMAI
jgi:hypothetical protein